MLVGMHGPDPNDEKQMPEPGPERHETDPRPDASLARRVLAMLDLTRLEDDADDGEIRALCRRAETGFGHPAAVCVYPAFVTAARDELESLGLSGTVAIATVANFPDGAAEPERAAAETRRAVAMGADEIDVVLPWKALRDGDDTVAARLVEQCRAACGERTLKVILESGMLDAPRLIRRAADVAIDAGADFVKTSTGKTDVGATPRAAEIMLDAIAAGGGRCGIKISGGVRTLREARGYVDLAAGALGPDWVRPDRFRFGASSLLDDLLAVLGPAGDATA